MPHFDEDNLQKTAKVVLKLLRSLVSVLLHIRGERLLKKLEHGNEHTVEEVIGLRTRALAYGREGGETR